MAPSARPIVMDHRVVVDNSNCSSNSNKYTQLCVAKVTASSRLLRKHKRRDERNRNAAAMDIPTSVVDSNEVTLGEILGTGAFSNVYELQNIHCLMQHPSSDDNADQDSNFCGADDHSTASSSSTESSSTGGSSSSDTDRNQTPLATTTTTTMANTSTSRHGALAADVDVGRMHDKRFAVKVLKPNASVDATIDFILETKYLAALTAHYPHKHIIQLHGVGKTSGSPNLMILERVDWTLSEQMDMWRSRPKDEPSSFPARLRAAMQLSSALAHLHSLCLIYRDLKPNNVGWCASTQSVKLFDFGLCKELNASTTRGMYCMSDLVCDRRRRREGDSTMEHGSIRSVPNTSYKYLAPEVVQHKPYSWSADTYSFAMVLWQVLSLEEDLFPKCHSLELYVKQVAIGKERPIIPHNDDNKQWSNSLQLLLQQSWAPDPNKRPSMKRISRELQQEVDVTAT